MSRILIVPLVLVLGATLWFATTWNQEPVRAAYWPSGHRQHEGAGQRGAENGPWTYWYLDGQIRERGEYVDGLRVGIWTQWYRGGQRCSRGHRGAEVGQLEGSPPSPRQGKWTFWHENGELRGMGVYRDGVRVGRWRFWNLDGGGRGVLDEQRSREYGKGPEVH